MNKIFILSICLVFLSACENAKSIRKKNLEHEYLGLILCDHFADRVNRRDYTRLSHAGITKAKRETKLMSRFRDNMYHTSINAVKYKVHFWKTKGREARSLKIDLGELTKKAVKQADNILESAMGYKPNGYVDFWRVYNDCASTYCWHCDLKGLEGLEEGLKSLHNKSN